MQPDDPADRAGAMKAAIVVAHIAVQLGEVDAATVFEVAGDATEGATTGNLVAVVQSLAALLAAVFRHDTAAVDAVAAFEATVPALATQIAPPPETDQ